MKALSTAILPVALLCFFSSLVLQSDRLGAQSTTGAVEGRVYDVATGESLPGFQIFVALQSSATGPAGSLSGTDGRFRIDGLEPGSYRFYIYRPGEGYVGQIYSQIPCPLPGIVGNFDSGCEDLLASLAGDSVAVGAGGTVAGIDFPLQLGGEITGQVTNSRTGEPIVSRFVLFTNQGGLRVVERGTTDTDGRYRIRSLPTRTYTMEARAAVGFHTISSRRVEVGLGETLVLDHSLEPWTTISGRLTEQGSGATVGPAQVEIYDVSGTLVWRTETDTEGFYRSRDLADGTYYLRTNVGFDRPWIDQSFGGGRCVSYLPCDVTAGTPVVIADETSVEGIDFALPVGGSISGQVVKGGLAGAAPIRIHGVDGTRLGTVVSDGSDGTYEVKGLIEGTYYLLALGGSAAPILYDGLPCGPETSPLSCDVTAGTPVPVALGETTPDIDFAFPASSQEQCIPSDTLLCLNGDRFGVEMTWETPSADSGQANGLRLLTADDSGYFYFFRPDNVEVVVKVLDACGTSFDSFWVFAAGLTNLRVEMTVTDFASGEVRTYTNPLRTPFEPILDTLAFDTCDAVPMNGVAPDLPASNGPNPELPNLDLPAPPRLRSQPALGEEGCVSDGLAVCLQGGRFKVEAEYRTAQGGSSGASESLTDDTGVFFFFGRDNAELVVKVLSNCGGPTNKFWVFAAGLTNVEVTLRVTDTLTGVVKTYINPLGESFQPILDTQAFDTCDGT